MPLLTCLIDDLLAARSDDKNLGVTQLRDVQDRLRRRLLIGVEEGATSSGCAMPLVGLGGRCFGLFVGSL